MSQSGSAQVYDATSDEEREVAVDAAALAIQRGRLVVLPTDTVYGVAADAFDPDAVARLLEAKGRGREMPPPVLVSTATTLDALATKVPDYARALTAAFWPGPLTLVCHDQPSLRWDLGETHGTVAVRMPDHDLTREILDRTGPLAVSSANLTGSPAATDAAAAVEMLGDRVAVVVDGGATDGAVPSTIVDVTGDRPRLLRLGMITVAQLDEAMTGTGLTVETDAVADARDARDSAGADGADS
ncbi:L-threonylcarbamoyladenylate synthase [Nocardioides bizhenqiangii]|uniref:L-threonylcarbamoyladenylate synthase n=1 Tax=Nocardioides bizhenqiangii TaxID=3095076 RepID=A0ABZ0ZLI2_9ACTN|nr:L-threonylcarbamoyladenylate synthase [Nocardioides sp. HM61]WQQ25196.1 L-threonylcarbamoyladenylate synthase [Nocardioides sp. HM61]